MCILVAERGQSLWAWPSCCSIPCTSSLGNMVSGRRKGEYTPGTAPFCFHLFLRQVARTNTCTLCPFLSLLVSSGPLRIQFWEWQTRLDCECSPKMLLPEKGRETEPIRMCTLLQEKKRNDAAPECGAEGKWPNAAELSREGLAQSKTLRRVWPHCSRQALQHGVVQMI